MLNLLLFINPASRETNIHRSVALHQSVSALSVLDTTRHGLGRDGAGLAEGE